MPLLENPQREELRSITSRRLPNGECCIAEYHGLPSTIESKVKNPSLEMENNRRCLRKKCRPSHNRKTLIGFPLLYTLVLFTQSIGFIRADDLPICHVNGECQPELLHNTGSFGNLFEVQTKEYPVHITEISFLTDLFVNVTFHAWTKNGPYKDFILDESAWTKIAEGSTIGLGKEIPTPIPQDSFESFWIQPEQTQSILIMLDSADIRYNYGTIEGSILDDQEDFQLLEGKSVVRFPPFDDLDSYFAPRAFTGSIKYTVRKPCEEPSTSPSSAPSLVPSQNPTTSHPTSQPSVVSSSRPSDGTRMTKVQYKYLFVVDLDEIEFVAIELHDLTEITLEQHLAQNDTEGATELEKIMQRGEVTYEGVTSTEKIGNNGKEFHFF